MAGEPRQHQTKRNRAEQIADDARGKQGQHQRLGSLSLPALREKMYEKLRSNSKNAFLIKYLQVRSDTARTVPEGDVDGFKDALRETRSKSARVPKDGSAVDDRQLHPALDRPIVERGVFRF